MSNWAETFLIINHFYNVFDIDKRLTKVENKFPIVAAARTSDGFPEGIDVDKLTPGTLWLIIGPVIEESGNNVDETIQDGTEIDTSTAQENSEQVDDQPADSAVEDIDSTVEENPPFLEFLGQGVIGLCFLKEDKTFSTPQYFYSYSNAIESSSGLKQILGNYMNPLDTSHLDNILVNLTEKAYDSNNLNLSNVFVEDDGAGNQTLVIGGREVS